MVTPLINQDFVRTENDIARENLRLGIIGGGAGGGAGGGMSNLKTVPGILFIYYYYYFF